MRFSFFFTDFARGSEGSPTVLKRFSEFPKGFLKVSQCFLKVRCSQGFFKVFLMGSQSFLRVFLRFSCGFLTFSE